MLVPEKFPIISGKDAVKALSKLGFSIKRQKGSHIVLQKDSRIFTVPLHSTLKKGTLHAILKQSNISLEELKRYI